MSVGFTLALFTYLLHEPLRKMSLVYLEPKAAYMHEYPSRKRDEILCLVCKSKREESYA
jgi:hypothetical protein